MKARRIILGLLTWNTRNASVGSARAHLREAETLKRLGHKVLVCVCDNGSTDGTQEALRSIFSRSIVSHHLIFNEDNKGSSIGRNQLIDVALADSADYLVFVDGDIELIPMSSIAMLRYLEDEARNVGCVGLDNTSCTARRSNATRFVFTIACVDTVDWVAWTQYGLFRCDAFRDGVRFDVRAPFNGPGWGFEDNDLAFQIRAAGYEIRRVRGLRYLHRFLRSSLSNLERCGLDVRHLYEIRRAFVYSKWQGSKHANLEAMRTFELFRREETH